MRTSTGRHTRAILSFSLLVTLLFIFVFAVGCGGHSGNSGSAPEGAPTPAPTPVVPGPTPTPSAHGYGFTPLIADTAGSGGRAEPALVNPWGLACSPTGPFWIANNGTESATVYDRGSATDQPPVPVDGHRPTGVAYNGSRAFVLQNRVPARVLFATESGTICAWNEQTPTAAVVIDRSAAGAVYKGLAIGVLNKQSFLCATDFHNARIDRFDSGLHFLNSFTDPTIPPGFAPFGIQNIRGDLYVTYARQKGPDNVQDDPGPGNGFVDIFRADGTLLARFTSNGPLSSPWGIALAPDGFGEFGGKLLIGNVGNGRINAFDPSTGAFVGEMQENNAHPMIVVGLWALSFGNDHLAGRADTLYFTSGPLDETHGLFGSIAVQ